MTRLFTIRAVSTITALLMTTVLVPATASALITANDADDVCPPATDPCVISEVVEVFGTLDFGLRTVRVTGGGRLRGQPDMILLCGELVVDVGGGTSGPVIEAVGDGEFVSITARRACSGDGTSPCTSDASCSGAGLGTCSLGSGTVSIDGRVSATGSSGGSVLIQGAGDVSVLRTVNVSGMGIEGWGGSADVRSTFGSVTIGGSIKSTPGAGQYYGLAGSPGEVELRAGLDVILTEQIQANGGGGEGTVRIEAGRDFIARAGINVDAGAMAWAHGGDIRVYADGDITLEPSGGQLVTRFRSDGGGIRYFYGYGGAYEWQSGYGGYNFLNGGNITIQQNTFLESQGGPGYGPGGGLYLNASETITVDGQIIAQAIGPQGGVGGRVELLAQDGVSIGQTGQVFVQSPFAGGEVIISTNGTTSIYGVINVRGTEPPGEYSYASSGRVDISGDTNVIIGGSIVGGGVERGDHVSLDVCRLTVTKNGKIDLVQGQSDSRPPILLTIRESMTAEDNSKLLTEPEARFEIRYRDPNKVPVLEGDLAPAPLLIVDPSLTGCPVCGNTEIDQGESCDDGNTTSGDGCRDDCQAELCIAQTPGFPGVSLCDDGDACTADVCDPVAGCSNPISCEEGVACTVDVCVAGSCEHTPDDTLCEDANDCTIDVCDAASGCGHTGLTGDPCEDGDMCTVTGTCQSGSCVVTDVSLTENHKITAKLKAGAANDLLKVKLDMPFADFAADPSVSGATLELFDENDASIYAATLGAADWVDKRGDGRQFTFADTQGPSGPANGVTKAKIKRIDKKGVARTVVTMKGSEIPGAANQLHMSLSLLFGLDPATDDCLSARRVPCKVSATRTSCR